MNLLGVFLACVFMTMFFSKYCLLNKLFWGVLVQQTQHTWCALCSRSLLHGSFQKSISIFGLHEAKIAYSVPIHHGWTSRRLTHVKLIFADVVRCLPVSSLISVTSRALTNHRNAIKPVNQSVMGMTGLFTFLDLRDVTRKLNWKTKLLDGHAYIVQPWLWTTNIFCNIAWWLTLFKSLIILSFVSIDISRFGVLEKWFMSVHLVQRSSPRCDHSIVDAD
jgi:hypothetical protein